MMIESKLDHVCRRARERTDDHDTKVDLKLEEIFSLKAASRHVFTFAILTNGGVRQANRACEHPGAMPIRINIIPGPCTMTGQSRSAEEAIFQLSCPDIPPPKSSPGTSAHPQPFGTQRRSRLPITWMLRLC